MIYQNITGIILAGGKSSRIGVNKSLLEIHGKKVIEYIKDILITVFKNVILISNESSIYNFLNLPVYPDIHKNKGPLCGIHSGLNNSLNEKNFILSCDMPLVSKELINYITKYWTKKNIIVTSVNGKIQPLCGIYKKSTVPYIERQLNDVQAGNFSIHKLLDTTESEIIEISGKDFYTENIFFNINNKEDYYNIKRILAV